MKKVLFILLFPYYIYAGHYSENNHINPYFSPGIQIGVNSEGTFFVSIQGTVGIVTDDIPNDFYPPIGITLGKRFYYMKNKKWNSYNYIDAQICTLIAGFGYGLITNGNERYNKFKIFAGAWGLLSYDYINWTNKKHHFGAFGVLPIAYEGGDFNID